MIFRYIKPLVSSDGIISFSYSITMTECEKSLIERACINKNISPANVITLILTENFEKWVDRNPS